MFPDVRDVRRSLSASRQAARSSKQAHRTLKAIGVAAIIGLTVVLTVPKALRRRRAHARAAFLSEYWDWIGAQVQKSLLPSGRPVAPACVLVTHYTVATEADATALQAWVASQTEDYVQVELKPSDEYRWRVVTATETRLVTSALAVEWVQSMRRVCEQFPARPVAWGVIWGGSPPTPTPAHAARG